MSDLNTSVDIYNYYNNQKTTGIYQPAKVPIPTSDVGHKSTTVLPDSDDANNTLSFEDMLLLMVTQLQNQTIDNTADTSDMMNQLTQMTSIQAMTGMTASMESLVKSNTLSYGASLVNKEVTIGVYNEKTKEYDELYGKVEAMGMYNGEPVIFIEGKSYPLSNVMAVGKLPEKVDPPETDDKEDGDGEGNGEVTDPDKTPEVPDEDAKG